jgi:hypothetical protein
MESDPDDTFQKAINVRPPWVYKFNVLRNFARKSDFELKLDVDWVVERGWGWHVNRASSEINVAFLVDNFSQLRLLSGRFVGFEPPQLGCPGPTTITVLRFPIMESLFSHLLLTITPLYTFWATQIPFL